MTESLGLLVGHLLGDFVLQNDWMARNKVKAAEPGWLGVLACSTHCLVYSWAIWVHVPWLPCWALLIVFGSHWVIDRYRLARAWMRWAFQEEFAQVLSPWSVIAVDQTMHLAVLYWLARVVEHFQP